MLKSISKIILLIYMSFSSLGYAQQEIVDKIIAIVDDNIILQSELLQYALNFSFQMKIDPRTEPEKFEVLQKQVLENIINQKIFLAKAEEDTIQVNEREVDNVLNSQVERMIEQLGSVEKLEEYLGAPLNKIKRDFREDVRDNLKVESLKAQYIRKIQISRREVEEFYRTMKDSLPDIQETVDISHILIVNKPGEAAVQKALENIKAVQEKIRTGEDFADLAKRYSEDPGSRTRGGELGFFQRGEFVKEFEEVAFVLQPNEISDVVRTEHGYHIIQMIERQGEKVNVRHILVRVEATKEDALVSDKKIYEIYTLLSDSSQDFGELAKQFSDDETTKNEKGYLGQFAVDELQEKEFKKALENLEPGEISQPFKTRFGWHILKLNDRKEARTLSIENDWEQIEKWALTYKQQDDLNSWLEKLKKDTFVDIKK